MGDEVSSVNNAAERDARAGAGLRDSLLGIATQLVREHGHEKLSLREVQRLAGVSPAAAYRHYRNRDALLIAVGQRSSALLSDHIAAAIGAVDADRARDTSGAATIAVARLRAGIRAYLAFASTEPGLFATVTMTGERPEDLADPAQASRGTSTRGPFQLLRDRLDELGAVNILIQPDRAWTDVAVWAATHGMAVLMLDGPLRYLTKTDAEAAIDRLVDLVVAGLTTPPA